MVSKFRIMFRLWIISTLLCFVAAKTTVVGNTRFVVLDEGRATYGNESICTNENIRIRKEWRRLSLDEKQSYIKAVQCLHELPPKTKQYFEATHSRYDDFVALHMNATNGGIHNVGVFLPWHRLTVWTYESTLRSECNYTGAQPYWDYQLDTPENGGHFNTSPIFDPTTGFGGSGKPALGAPAKCGMTFGDVCGNCVTDGPFAKYQIYLGPGNSFKSNPRCLKRMVNGGVETGARKEEIDKLMGKGTYEGFQTLDSSMKGGVFVPGVHSMGHFGVGGDMTNLWSSTNDPLFWLHHTELDRLWAMWQGNNQTRLNDLAAPASISLGAMLGAKSGGKKTDAQTVIWMGQFPPSLPMGKVADTQNRNGNGVLCYRYEG